MIYVCVQCVKASRVLLIDTSQAEQFQKAFK